MNRLAHEIGSLALYVGPLTTQQERDLLSCLKHGSAPQAWSRIYTLVVNGWSLWEAWIAIDPQAQTTRPEAMDCWGRVPTRHQIIRAIRFAVFIEQKREKRAA